METSKDVVRVSSSLTILVKEQQEILLLAKRILFVEMESWTLGSNAIMGKRRDAQDALLRKDISAQEPRKISASKLVYVEMAS